MVWGLGLRVEGLDVSLRAWVYEIRVQGLGLRFEALGFFRSGVPKQFWGLGRSGVRNSEGLWAVKWILGTRPST